MQMIFHSFRKINWNCCHSSYIIVFNLGPIKLVLLSIICLNTFWINDLFGIPGKASKLEVQSQYTSGNI